MNVVGAGYADRPLGAEELVETLLAGLDRLELDRQRVLVLVPDGTRSMPLGELFALVHDALVGRVAALDVLVALGTHPAMPMPAIERHFGLPAGTWAERYPTVTVSNHEWWLASAFADLGAVPADEVAALSGGLLAEDVPVRVNRKVTEYDACLVLGPVFPHEVVGYSGGDKYFFPGVAGPEVIDASHWLGALITSTEIIGRRGITPVRELIHRAAARIPSRRLCVAVVVAPETKKLHGLYVGDTHAAWAAAADLSSQVHVRYVERPFRRVVSVVPSMYDDMWTAAKGMYKVEPVVADGGEVIVLAPHVSTFSYTHDPLIRRVGYHCRDYFLGQPGRFAEVPRGVLAHSTHLRGAGTYDPATAVEQLRIAVTLATAIPPDECAAVNLGWRDPADIDLAALAAEPGTLVVPRAGELLYRLAADRLPDGPPTAEVAGS